MQTLLEEIKQCRYCEQHLPMGANPIVSANVNSKIILIGQAPGRIVHQTCLPWNDKSGDNLREWLGVEKDVFYASENMALIPMGFCYPGTGKSGDLPPRPECAPLWHEKLLTEMPQIQLTILIGSYAQRFYLDKTRNCTLTDTVRNFHNYLPRYFPLPHPSPRNNIWQAKNPWFKAEVLPALRKQVQAIIRNK